MNKRAEQIAAEQSVIEKAAAHWTSLPENAEIDALLSLYDEADKGVDDAIAKRNIFGDQIEELIVKHGFMPPRATKSKRIQGEEWKATQSQSHSVDVDSTAVLRLFALMKELHLARWFRKLFRREEVFVLNDGAQELMNKLEAKFPGMNLAMFFSRTLRIASRSTTLKVEPIEKDKVRKGAAA